MVEAGSKVASNERQTARDKHQGNGKQKQPDHEAGLRFGQRRARRNCHEPRWEMAGMGLAGNGSGAGVDSNGDDVEDVLFRPVGGPR